jgi:Raf kinase inhibitor-like YbhB/YbcL family protein
MKKIIFIALAALIILALAAGIIIFKRKPNSEKINSEANTVENQEIKINMKLTSPAFENNSLIPAKYTCDGENVSPPLKISDVPEGTISLALVVDDPDAPAGDWTHWVVWNIDPNLSEIVEGKSPNGAVIGANDFGKREWEGPCPPSGTHHYQFRLYALDTKLDISPEDTKNSFSKSLEGHILQETKLIGLYKKQ